MIYTLNKLVTINSKYGDQENGTMKSKMLFNYQSILSDDDTVLKSFVTVLNAQIPCSFYVINSTNNKLIISGPTITTKTIIISNGNYNANTLITELISKIGASGLNMEITINKSNGIITFTSSGFVNFYLDGTILEILGIEKLSPYPAGSISHGNARLVGLARAVAAHPKYLIMDEPAAGLNEDEAPRLLHALELVRKNIGCGMLLVEHNVKLVTQACSRVIVLATGILIFDGNPQDALNNADVKSAYLGNAGVH
jgi:hypothetical protein